jgi:hypothetical protein
MGTGGRPYRRFAVPPCCTSGHCPLALSVVAENRSINSTRVYLHLSTDWLDDEYRRASEAIEAQALVGVAQ